MGSGVLTVSSHDISSTPVSNRVSNVGLTRSYNMYRDRYLPPERDVSVKQELKIHQWNKIFADYKAGEQGRVSCIYI